MTESRNVPRVTVRDTLRSAEVTRAFAIDGAPNLAAQFSDKPFRPEQLTIKLQDGTFHHVVVTGRRVLSRGVLGQNRGRKAWYSVRELEESGPAWVKDAVVTVLQQEGAR